jgi:allantoin racemase
MANWGVGSSGWRVAVLKILVVNPIVKSEITESIRETWAKVGSEGIVLDFRNLEEGPDFVETEEHERLAVPDLLRVAKDGETQGYSAIVINCFGDPGLEEAKKLVRIPVVGAGEASFLVAKESQKRFSVITTVKEAVVRVRRNARKYGAEPFLASIRPLNMHVPELNQKPRLRKALLNEAGKALREDQAEIIVLGCTAMAGNARWLAKELALPAVDPTEAAIKRAKERIEGRLG